MMFWMAYGSASGGLVRQWGLAAWPAQLAWGLSSSGKKCRARHFAPLLLKRLLRGMGSAQIDVKISFKGRQPNKESAAKPLCRYVSPATVLHFFTFRNPDLRWNY